MRILKFGGKSLDSKEKVKKICKFIKNVYENEKKLIIVVSAMGTTTDNLISQSIDFGYSNQTCKSHEFQAREFARLLSTGEIQSASLFSMSLISMGIPAKSFSATDISISTFGGFLDAKISYISKSKLNDELSKGVVCVVAGFQGINKNGEITTLGRGGSDTTAVALGAVFGEQVEIYSDYDGIFTGDPKDNSYKKVREIDYTSVINMADGGAKVLDSRAVKICKDYNLSIISKCSAYPNLKGTIVGSIEKDNIAISTISNLSKITITFSNKLRQEQITKSVLKSIKNFNFYNLTLSTNSLEFFVLQKDLIIISNKISKSLKLLKE